MKEKSVVCRTRLTSLVSLVAVFVLTASGCDILGPRTPPDQMRIEVEGSSPEPLRLITSRRFFIDGDRVGVDGGVVYLTADTTMISLPRDETYNLQPDNRLAVRVERPEQGQVALTLRVFIDNDKVFDVTETREGSFLQYYFTWN